MSIAISSMMRPGRRLITSTRSDSVTASSRSWVISSAVLPARFSVCARSLLQHHAGLGVDRRERLVEQQHRRIDRERARQRHALAHAAGQLMRIVAGEFGELEVFQQRLRAPLAARPAARPGFRRRTSRSRSTVRHGSSRSFCSMKATWAFGPSTRSPSTKASPSLGASSPEPILSSVDLAAAARPDQRHHLAVARPRS